MFGPIPSSSATAACDATNRITSHFCKDSLTALVQMTTDEYGDRVLFGKNLKFLSKLNKNKQKMKNTK